MEYMTRYTRRQPASAFSLIVLIVCTLFVTYLAVILQHPIVIIVAILLTTVLGLFSAMTVSIDTSQIRLSYGFGLLRFNFPLADITSVKKVRNKWWYGWGIHLTPHGWLFNIAGLDAVELTMTSGKKYRIGTAVPEELAQCIRSHEAVLALSPFKRTQLPVQFPTSIFHS